MVIVMRSNKVTRCAFTKNTSIKCKLCPAIMLPPCPSVFKSHHRRQTRYLDGFSAGD